METRQENLLKLVVEHHVATAEPVGSKFLVDKGKLEWSEATVRNDLRALEEEGFLTHPHTSAGRTPTARGYRYYVDHFDVAKFSLHKSVEKKLLNSISGADYEGDRKKLARTMVEISGETVLLAFDIDRVYYTGLGNLFQKPDFAEFNLVASVSAVFDRCEESLESFFPLVGKEPRCFIGQEHTFGEMFSIVAVRFGEDLRSLIALLGPQRMNYGRNWNVLKIARELL